ncbi:hypothetical protein [Halococcus thailandensis]|nr:hypothetical protein [Halococcus thailandensis]
MTSSTDRTATDRSDGRLGSRRLGRAMLTAVLLVAGLGSMPVASAHGGTVTVNGFRLEQWFGLVPLVVGLGIVVASQYLHRLRPAAARYRLHGTIVGLVVGIFGAIWIVQLSPYEWLTAQPIVPRAIHAPLMLLVGGGIMLASVLVGQFRWSRQPRFAGLGVLLGLWVAYPGLSAFGLYTETNSLGYLIVLGLVVGLGYVLYRDAGGLIRQLLADRTARRFGIAVGGLSVLFFAFSSGMLYLIPDDGTGVSLSEQIVSVLPVADPLVMWPAVEFWYPDVPIGGVVSVGTVLLVTLFGTLIGLNAALFAFQSGSGTSQTGAGIAGIAAPQACCCCGPALSQIAVVVLGPSAGAPIYLLFGDPSSSIGSLFFVASVAVLTGLLVRATDRPDEPQPEPATAPA